MRYYWVILCIGFSVYALPLNYGEHIESSPYTWHTTQTNRAVRPLHVYDSSINLHLGYRLGSFTTQNPVLTIGVELEQQWKHSSLWISSKYSHSQHIKYTDVQIANTAQLGVRKKWVNPTNPKTSFYIGSGVAIHSSIGHQSGIYGEMGTSLTRSPFHVGFQLLIQETPLHHAKQPQKSQSMQLIGTVFIGKLL